MNLVKLSIKNIQSKPLNTLLSLLLLTLSVALVAFMLQLNEQVKGKLDRNIKPVDMVVGAKGSPMQLVLSSVLHIDNPTGNILLVDAENIGKNPLIEKAIPVSYGDNYQGFRILGTVPEYLAMYEVNIKSGTMFKSDLEVVVGARVAEVLDLKIGDRFVGSHGLVEQSLEEHAHHEFRVVGILANSGTVVDQLIVTNLESIWKVHEHEEEHVEEEEYHEEPRAVTSLLVKFRNPMGTVTLPRIINENTNMQAALPKYEVDRLFGLLGIGMQTIAFIALAIMLVSGLSIFISLYRALKERKYELALMRTYGATARQLVWVVMLEGLFLGIIGFLLGWVFSRLGLLFFSSYTENTYGYSMMLNKITLGEFWLFIASIGIAIVATLLASLGIFKMNISKILAEEG
ncbi:ABC transporter permease [Flavobacteriaceae bacterium F08102]|nr:ABC transporter permease [Flavobacteriaceae bacterium F08102]